MLSHWESFPWGFRCCVITWWQMLLQKLNFCVPRDLSVIFRHAGLMPPNVQTCLLFLPHLAVFLQILPNPSCILRFIVLGHPIWFVHAKVCFVLFCLVLFSYEIVQKQNVETQEYLKKKSSKSSLAVDSRDCRHAEINKFYEWSACGRWVPCAISIAQ